MINEIAGVVGTGFVAGAAAGTMVLIITWVIAAAINLIKKSMKGDDEA